MVKSIPPITATGKERRKKPARLQGLGHMSLGRYLAERRGEGFGGGMGNMQGSSYDISQHIVKQAKSKPKPATVRYESEIGCIPDIIEGYPSDEHLGVILEFKGLHFLSDTFTEHKGVYFTPVSFKNKEARLMLSTMGDILESEVVPQRKEINQIFSDETHIPKLTETYDPSSMEVVRKNGLIIISYKKQAMK
jgi:hypothetical protein